MPEAFPQAPDYWYALNVKTGMESAISRQIEAREIESFLPQYEDVYAKRKTPVKRALFPGYIFGRFLYERRFPVLDTPGVLGIVGTREKPGIVTAEEIDGVRRLIDSGRAEPWNQIEPGRIVTIRQGAFAGIRGVLVRVKDRVRVIVNIQLLNRAVSVELDRHAIAA